MALNPKYERSYYLLGCINQYLKNYELAVEFFKKFLSFESDPDYYPVVEAKENLKVCESELSNLIVK